MNPSILPIIAGIIPTFILGGIMYFQKKQLQGYINPLTRATRRPPGTQLGRELGAAQIGAMEPFLFALLGCYTAVIVYLMAVVKQGREVSEFSLFLAATVWVGALVYGAISMTKLLKRIRILRLAYECEIAVGQELNQLMLKGFHVFHDVQCGNFNIDHVVVGATGVFAVETKGRSKRVNSRGKGKSEYKVRYENNTLYFPGWTETKPMEQAAIQAQWLAKSLSNAVGMSVAVQPVVVLPGWFVDTKFKAEIPVLAGGEH